jgi:Uncharacterised nucleotidyltransferase
MKTQTDSNALDFDNGPLALSMLQQVAARQVLETTRALKLPCIFLKGSALAYWLYENPQDRECGDVDVLVPSYAEAQQLAQMLVCEREGRAFEPWGQTAHERLVRLFVKPGCMVEIDIHWGLVNSPLFALSFEFDELWQNTQPIEHLGESARGLTPVYALMHACLHMAMNQALGVSSQDKWLEDVMRLTQQLSPYNQEELVVLAQQKGFGRVCAHAIKQSETGLGWVCQSDLLDRLKSNTEGDRLDPQRLNSFAYMFSVNWRAWTRLSERLRWLGERLFPRLDYLRLLYERPQASRMSLLIQRMGALCRFVLSGIREK